jgi:hypothetical protein
VAHTLCPRASPARICFRAFQDGSGSSQESCCFYCSRAGDALATRSYRFVQRFNFTAAVERPYVQSQEFLWEQLSCPQSATVR